MNLLKMTKIRRNPRHLQGRRGKQLKKTKRTKKSKRPKKLRKPKRTRGDGRRAKLLRHLARVASLSGPMGF